MNVRALRAAPAALLPGSLLYLDIKLDWKLLGGITSIVVTRLVFEFPVHGIGAQRRVGLSDQRCFHNHVAGINAQLLRGIKGKADELPGRVLNFCDHQIGRWHEAEAGGDQLRRGWLAGVDVISASDMKSERERSGLSLLYRNQVHRTKLDVGSPQTGGTRFLGKGKGPGK